MKNAILIIVLLLEGTTSIAQGITFEKCSFDRVLKKAKVTNKPLFIEFHTSWCGPSNVMESTVFSNDRVGDFYNAQFLNMKIDLETIEAKELIEKYQITSIPTQLYVDPSGELLHMTIGGKDIDDFLEDGKVALDPNKRESDLDTRYAGGERTIDFLLEYVQSRESKNQEMVAHVAKDFYDNTAKEHLVREKEFSLLTYYGAAVEYGSAKYMHILKHDEKLKAMKSIGSVRFCQVIANSVLHYLNAVVEEVDSEQELILKIDRVMADFPCQKWNKWITERVLGNYYFANNELSKWYKIQMGLTEELPVVLKSKMMEDVITTMLENTQFESEGLYKRLIRDIEKMLEDNPDDLGLTVHLVDLYLKENKRNAARVTYNKHIEILKDGDKWELNDPLQQTLFELEQKIEKLYSSSYYSY